MFHIFRKKISLLRCNSLSSQLCTLLTPVREFSPSSSPPPPRQPHSNCSCNVPVKVWWNIDECGVPSGVSFLKVAPAIMTAVRANGIYGRIDIRAFADFWSSKIDKEALVLTGIGLHPISGVNDNARKCLLMDLNDWVSKNPPPAHLFLILRDGDDRDISGILHRLRMKKYNILYASFSGRESDILCGATTIMWRWSSILKGEDLTGIHFNYPPDGSINPWYGDSWYLSSVDDDDKRSFQSIPSQGKPIGESVDSKSTFPSFKESNVQPLNELQIQLSSNDSDSVVSHPSSAAGVPTQNAYIHEPSSQVIEILSLYPKGITVVDLNAELTKCGIPFSKKLFRHKNLSKLLESIPEVQLMDLGEGIICARLTPPSIKHHFTEEQLEISLSK